MKTFLFIVLTLLAQNGFSCTCMEPNFTEKYFQSDFVASVKIVKNYKNVGEQIFYKSEIVIQKLYKGDSLSTLFVEGNSDGRRRTSCDIFIPENTELIVYVVKTGENRYKIGSCSGLLYLTAKPKNAEKRELEMLDLFKAKTINFTDRGHYFIRQDSLQTFLEKFQGIQLNKSYAVYELLFAPDMSVKQIHAISGFNDPVDEKIMAFFKLRQWKCYSYGTQRSKVDDNTRFLIGIYFYKEEGPHKSFLGIYDL